MCEWLEGSTTRTRDIEVVPGQLRIARVQAGESAPFEGWVVPPSVMAEIGPALAEALDKYKKGQNWSPTQEKENALEDPFADGDR